jgi:hypothetical protein
MTNELQKHLKEHLQFIKASAHSFDAGFEGEAKRLAVSARVLLHDTAQSHSLMGQLGLLGIPFYSTVGSSHQLLQMRLSTSGSSYHVPLDDRPPHMLTWVSFDDWWSGIVFDDMKGNTLTRKQLVLALANKEGGAHIDLKLSPMYEAIAKDNALGWLVSTPSGMIPLPGRVELLGMRQVAHEIVRTLEKSGYQ